MEDPGQHLRTHRERLQMKYRDVAEASLVIAERHKNALFRVGLSRLSEIENHGTLPTIYRLYSLCAVYGLSLNSVLSWYGIDTDQLEADITNLKRNATAILDDRVAPEITAASIPAATSLASSELKSAFPFSTTEYDVRHRYRYAIIGAQDLSMYPVLNPGAVVEIDTRKRKIAQSGWNHELERPLYVVEHRHGVRCGWCSEHKDHLIVHSHPASGQESQVFKTSEADMIGQVVAITTRVGQDRERRKRSSTGQE